MRLTKHTWMTAIVLAGCVSAPKAGRLGDGEVPPATIAAVDSALPPRSATVELTQPAYAALLLVAPGHSATVVYPGDSTVDNRLGAGTHRLAFEIPAALVRTDSAMLAARARDRQRADSARIATTRSRTARTAPPPPINPAAATYLLLITSPQPLRYSRLIEKTAGVSIPTMETEALNAVGKAIKATLAEEPRDWSGYYQIVELTRDR